MKKTDIAGARRPVLIRSPLFRRIPDISLAGRMPGSFFAHTIPIIRENGGAL